MNTLRTILAALTAALAGAVAPAQFLTPDRKMAMTERLIETFYVAPVDTNRVVEEGIKAMLRTLDPHSSYTTAEETRELNEPLQGNFSGVGIQFQMLDDTLYVVQTIAGGPSERMGMLPGDRILQAGDSLLSGVKRKNTDVQRILRGPKGTVVDVTVKRAGVAEPIYFTITRDDIPINSVDAAYMAEPGIGYIRISRFGEDTPREVYEALESLEREGMRSLIIDLQSNGGGYLNAAEEVAEMLLPKGAPIVYTEGDRVETFQYAAQRDGRWRDMPVTVIVNQYSASAAEILAGAVQDNDRGTVVGRRTFGKGLVQRPFPFPDGSMIRLTVARYHTPSGRCIQKPYTPGEDEDYARDMERRYKSGEFTSADSIKFDPALAYRTLRLGRTVYGGGGIMPDRFVPLDTVEYTPLYRNLMAKGIFNKLAVTEVDRNRAALRAEWPSEEAFLAGFEVTPELAAELRRLGEEADVEWSDEDAHTSAALFARVIKGLIGRDLFTQATYLKAVLPADESYRAALEEARSPRLP